MAVISKIEVGDRIEQLRDLLNMKSRPFALAVGADPSYLAKVEKGEKSLSKSVLDSIVDKYKVNESWLLMGHGDVFQYGTNVPHETQHATNVVAEPATVYEVKAKSADYFMTVIATLSESNAKLAESNTILARNNEKLVDVVTLNFQTVGSVSTLESGLKRDKKSGTVIMPLSGKKAPQTEKNAGGQDSKKRRKKGIVTDGGGK